LRELAALIAECDALVSTDSGPMHIGYATRTPLVAIFGSTEPSLTGPVGYGYKVIRHTLLCTPCYKRECKARSEKNMACMTEVTVDEVFEALGKVLPKKRAVFFDRDGTLCEYREYLSDWGNFKIMHDIDDLHRLIIKDYKLIGATNQSGIARGLIKENFAKEVNAVFLDKHGFTDFYYCPHHPDEHCACRKPEPEMLLRARGERGIYLKESFVVGDGETDMLLARAVGARAVLIESERADDSVDADYRAKSLTDAVEWILSQQS
jgi:heptosyltransferase-2